MIEYHGNISDFVVFLLTSAPSPSLKPSANLELVLWKTQALSTAPRNLSAVSRSSVTITSVCPDPYLTKQETCEKLCKTRQGKE